MISRSVYLLVREMSFATKLVKAAQTNGFKARAFDRAERLLEAARKEEPNLVILDGEGLEKEAFQLLDTFRSEASLSKIPRLGYLSPRAQALKRELREAGCTQVYGKSELTREFENLLARYAYGVSSRI